MPVRAEFREHDHAGRRFQPSGIRHGRRRTSRSSRTCPPPPRLARPPRKPRKPHRSAAAADIMHGLSKPGRKVKGVGPKMAQLLNKLGIFTINDLLFFLPRRYDDYTQLNQISRLQPNMLATVIGTVRYTEMRIARGGRKDFYMVVDDGTAQMGVTFFGQYYLNRQVRTEQQVVLRGANVDVPEPHPDDQPGNPVSRTGRPAKGRHRPGLSADRRPEPPQPAQADAENRRILGGSSARLHARRHARPRRHGRPRLGDQAICTSPKAGIISNTPSGASSSTNCC